MQEQETYYYAIWIYYSWALPGDNYSRTDGSITFKLSVPCSQLTIGDLMLPLQRKVNSDQNRNDIQVVVKQFHIQQVTKLNYEKIGNYVINL